MNTPLELEAYVAMIEAGSISEAARRLGEPRATLSRRLTRLEEHLGVRLVHRATRHFEPTRAGRELYARGRRIVDEVRATEQALRALDGTPRGPIRISIPSGNAARGVGELLAAFLARYPEVTVDVLATDRHVDLVREGFDVALRAGRISDPSLVQRVLMRDRTVLVASPAYLDARGVPDSPEALARHACIVGYDGGDRVWPAFPLRDGGEVRVPAAMASNAVEVVASLAVAGRGLAVLPRGALAELLDRGLLREVLVDTVGRDITVSLVYPDRRLLEPQVRAFLDFALAWMTEGPNLLKPRPCVEEGPPAP